MRRRQFLRALPLAGVVATAGCTSGRVTPTEVETGDREIKMTLSDGEHYFDPVGLAVEPGETVTWVNERGSHSTVSYSDDSGKKVAERRIPDGATGWNSGIVHEAGETVARPFEVEGTYDYFCDSHDKYGMVGRIVVGDPGGPADDQFPPSGTVPAAGRIVEAGSVSFAEFDG